MSLFPNQPWVALLFLTLLLGGCATSRPTVTQEADRIRALARDLQSLGSETDAWEAERLARHAYLGALELAAQYQAVRPAWLHNMMVNSGLRSRGLCYHWMEDLTERLAPLPVQSFEIHRAVARQGTSHEHNALVVTPRGQPFTDGLVLDAWRRSGQLVWSRVAQDRYPWKPNPQ